MRFVVDCMLGRLAKWLKIFGFDTLFLSKAEDRELLEISRREGRILLTRDTGLIAKGKALKDRLYIESERWDDQVVQVLDKFKLWDDILPNSRCISCNTGLKPLPKSQARNLVTPFVYDNADSFALCPACGRVFWQGTHFSDMEAKMERILKRRGN